MVSINYNAFVTDNFFDAGTIDGTVIFTIRNTSSGWTLKNNIGQSAAVVIGGELGFKGITPVDNTSTRTFVSSGAITGTALIGLDTLGIKTSISSNIAVTYIPDSTQRGMIWAVPMEQIIPHDSYLTQIIVIANATAKFANSSVLNVYVTNASSFTGSGSETAPMTYDFGPTGTYLANTDITLTINIPYGQARMSPDIISGKFPNLIMQGSPMSDTGGGIFYLRPISAIYRW